MIGVTYDDIRKIEIDFKNRDFFMIFSSDLGIVFLGSDYGFA